MNSKQFNQEMTELINKAVNQGVAKGELGIDSIVGVLEIQKQDLIRWVQDKSRALEDGKQTESIILPKRSGVIG